MLLNSAFCMVKLNPRGGRAPQRPPPGSAPVSWYVCSYIRSSFQSRLPHWGILRRHWGEVSGQLTEGQTYCKAAAHRMNRKRQPNRAHSYDLCYADERTHGGTASVFTVHGAVQRQQLRHLAAKLPTVVSSGVLGWRC